MWLVSVIILVNAADCDDIALPAEDGSEVDWKANCKMTQNAVKETDCEEALLQVVPGWLSLCNGARVLNAYHCGRQTLSQTWIDTRMSMWMEICPEALRGCQKAEPNDLDMCVNRQITRHFRTLRTIRSEETEGTRSKTVGCEIYLKSNEKMLSDSLAQVLASSDERARSLAEALQVPLQVAFTHGKLWPKLDMGQFTQLEGDELMSPADVSTAIDMEEEVLEGKIAKKAWADQPHLLQNLDVATGGAWTREDGIAVKAVHRAYSGTVAEPGSLRLSGAAGMPGVADNGDVLTRKFGETKVKGVPGHLSEKAEGPRAQVDMLHKEKKKLGTKGSFGKGVAQPLSGMVQQLTKKVVSAGSTAPKQWHTSEKRGGNGAAAPPPASAKAHSIDSPIHLPGVVYMS